MRHGIESKSLQSGVADAGRPELWEQSPEARGEMSENPCQPAPSVGTSTISNDGSTDCEVTLLTGGGDRPYALGLATALSSARVSIDFIGSDDLKAPAVLDHPRVNFLNLRGDQFPEASIFQKIVRVSRYYWSLVCYAATARPVLFHLLWNNKLELLDRTVLMLYYRLLGKKVVLTVHNVNIRERDSNDSWLNRVSLRIQYSLSDHLFAHTERMKAELVTKFDIPASKVSVIPFGINNTVPNTNLSSAEAKRRLGVKNNDKVILFFGNIAPYKGLEYLVDAFIKLLKLDETYRLIIVGRPKGPKDYWEGIQKTIRSNGIAHRTIERIECVPDEETELFFKAADVLVLPYTHVFQSGVLFLGYGFGLPAIAADVGSLRDEIIEGETGFVFPARASADLAAKIEKYFSSDLFRDLENRRARIKAYANERYSWTKVAAITARVYCNLASFDR
jgi:glycosyltransferase involved in cell wall biosynthesis